MFLKEKSQNDKNRELLLAKKLALFRKESNMSQAELADKLNCSQSTVSKLEMGLREMRVIEFFDIAKVLDKNLDEFFV